MLNARVGVCSAAVGSGDGAAAAAQYAPDNFSPRAGADPAHVTTRRHQRRNRRDRSAEHTPRAPAARRDAADNSTTSDDAEEEAEPRAELGTAHTVRNLDTGEVYHMSEIEQHVATGTSPTSLRGRGAATRGGGASSPTPAASVAATAAMLGRAGAPVFEPLLHVYSPLRAAPLSALEPPPRGLMVQCTVRRVWKGLARGLGTPTFVLTIGSGGSSAAPLLVARRRPKVNRAKGVTYLIGKTEADVAKTSRSYAARGGSQTYSALRTPHCMGSAWVMCMCMCMCMCDVHV